MNKYQFTDENLAETGLSVIKAVLSGLGTVAIMGINRGEVDYKVLGAVVVFFLLSTAGKVWQEYKRSDR